MDLNFDGGALRDTKGKDGLASVCMAMLTEGTQQLDKIQYSEALADMLPASTAMPRTTRRACSCPASLDSSTPPLRCAAALSARSSAATRWALRRSTIWA
jgi:hypothetical protein